MSIVVETGFPIEEEVEQIIAKDKTIDDLLNAILEDIGDCDNIYAPQAQRAIGYAIERYREENFFFLRPREILVQGVVGQQYYGKKDNPTIPMIGHVDKVFSYSTSSSHPVEVFILSNEEMNSMQDMGCGTVRYFAFLGTEFRIVPAPQEPIYLKLYVSGTAMPNMTDPFSTSHWVTFAFDLIKECAKAYLFKNILVDLERYNLAERDEMREYDRLILRTSRKLSINRITPTDF